MKQQVTAAMMTMPTNKAEDTPMTRGTRSRSATGETESRDSLLRLRNHLHRIEKTFVCLYCGLVVIKIPQIANAAMLCPRAGFFISK